MAGTNRSTVVPAENMVRARDILSTLDMHVYVLDDFGRRIGETTFHAYTIREAVGGIVDELTRRLDEVTELLPTGDAWTKACVAHGVLVGIKEFLEAVIDDDWRISKQLAGSVVLDMTIRAAKEIERCELACGEKEGSMGYLAGTAGDPNHIATEEAPHG